MKKSLLLLTFCAGLTSLLAQEPPVAAEPPAPAPANSFFKTPEEKLSYALGLNMAAQLKRGTDDLKKVDLEEVMKGLRTVTGGTQSEDFERGLSFGLFLKQSGTKFEEKTLLMAVQDSIAGEASKLTDSETRSELMSLQNAMQQKTQAKQEAQAAKNLAEANAFLEKNGKEAGVVTTPSGLQYKILTDAPQGGKLKEGDIAEVNLGTFDIDGNRTDKGMEGKTRKVGQNINPGFTEAMKLMTIGSKYKLWIPPNLGFGTQPRPGVKPNALLTYEVELIAALEPPAKGSPAPLVPGAPAGPGSMKREPITATTPPVSVEIPADGGPPKVTPVDPAKPEAGK